MIFYAISVWPHAADDGDCYFSRYGRDVCFSLASVFSVVSSLADRALEIMVDIYFWIIEINRIVTVIAVAHSAVCVWAVRCKLAEFNQNIRALCAHCYNCFLEQPTAHFLSLNAPQKERISCYCQYSPHFFHQQNTSPSTHKHISHGSVLEIC